MAQVSDRPLIAALDIGSSKVSAMIATLDGERGVTVLGTGQRETSGAERSGSTASASTDSMRATRSTRPSRSRMSRFARPAAHTAGWPE